MVMKITFKEISKNKFYRVQNNIRSHFVAGDQYNFNMFGKKRSNIRAFQLDGFIFYSFTFKDDDKIYYERIKVKPRTFYKPEWDYYES